MSVLIFGGSGFIGKSIANQFLKQTSMKIIIASKHPLLANINHVNIGYESCDITNSNDISNLFEKYDPKYCINSVSTWRETKNISFESIHIHPLINIMNECNKYSTTFGYISGLGASPYSQNNFKSKYMKIRCQTEKIIVDNNKTKSCIFRPGAIISDSFPLEGMLTRLIPLIYNTPSFIPIPLFGDGSTKLSLISIDDLSKIVTQQLLNVSINDTHKIIECGSHDIISYKDLLNYINNCCFGVKKNKRSMIPVPFFVWWHLANMSEIGAINLLEKGQVELMQHDLVANNLFVHEFQYEDNFVLIQKAIDAYMKSKINND